MALTVDTAATELQRRGIPPVAARAFAEEFVSESGLDPAINERQPLVPGSRGGFGLAQWTGPRRRQLEEFARERGASPADPGVQFDFLAWELQNTESAAAPNIFNADTVEGARAAIITDFLRPAAVNQDRRLAELGQTRTDASPSIPPALLEAYDAGTLTPQQMSVVDRARAAGLIPEPQAPAMPRSVIDAYRAGSLTPEQAATVERAAERGLIQLDNAPDERRTVAESALRGLGLGARAVAQGAAGLADILYAPSAAVAGLAAGEAAQPALRDRVSQYLTRLGVPEPENATERVIQAAQEAATGAAGGVGVARAVGSAVTGPVARGVAEVAGALPGAQVASGIGAGAAQQTAAEMGAGPVGQTAAGLVGAVVGGAGPGMVRQGIPAVDDATGRVVQRVEPPVTTQARTTPGPAAIAGPEPQQMTADQIGALVRTAARGGRGSAAAIDELAKVARVNPAARDAAELLGIDMPPDVWADDQMIREAAGLTRSVQGGQAKANFDAAVMEAAERADEAMRTIDGSTDIATLSADIRDSLTNTQATLGRQASELYQRIDATVPQSTRIQPNGVVRALNRVIEDVGGVDGLTAAERRLYNMVTGNDPVTYRRLMREKDAIGRAIARGDGPYSDVNQGDLKRLYGALADDQLAAVQSVGGDALRNDLRLANQITAKKKGLERRIETAFGKDLDGSIAQRLRTAVTQAGKGDVANLNKILKTIPPETHRRALATAIADIAQTTRNGNRTFDFAGFTKFYSGLRRNAPVFKQVVGAIGEDGDKVLRSLYEVSKRITEARGNILTTGKANQALVQSMLAEGLVSQVLQSSVTRNAASGVGIGGGAMAGGAAGAAIGGILSGAISGAKADPMQRAGALFASEQFKKLATEAARRGTVSRGTTQAVTNSPAYRAWAKSSGIADPAQWLQGVIQSISAQTTQDQTNGR